MRNERLLLGYVDLVGLMLDPQSAQLSGQCSCLASGQHAVPQVPSSAGPPTVMARLWTTISAARDGDLDSVVRLLDGDATMIRTASCGWTPLVSHGALPHQTGS
jgi:hypothetical protein